MNLSARPSLLIYDITKSLTFTIFWVLVYAASNGSCFQLFIKAETLSVEAAVESILDALRR